MTFGSCPLAGSTQTAASRHLEARRPHYATLGELATDVLSGMIHRLHLYPVVLASWFSTASCHHVGKHGCHRHRSQLRVMHSEPRIAVFCNSNLSNTEASVS